MKKKNNYSGKGLTRRDFVKNTSMAAGGGLLLSSLPVGAGAFAGGTAEIKLALIGCGNRGTGAVFNAMEADKGVKLVAMADVFKTKLEDSYNTLNKKYGDTDRLKVPEEHKFLGFDAYKHAMELADVVILTTPPGFRPVHFEEAVNAGKHIFMEKPVATDAPGIRRVLEYGEKAREKGLNVVVGLQRHYQRSYQETLKRIREGQVGRIISGQVYWNSAGVWVRDRKPDMNEMEYQMWNWYYFNWLCGDHIVEQHVHNIDVANWFIGEYPSKAQGMGGREVRTGKQYGQIFDHHFVEFTYPSGAVIASQSRHQPDTFHRVAETFQGSRGTVDTDGRDKALIRDYDGNLLYEHDGSEDPNPYQQEHNRLFAAIRNGETINDVEYGAKSTMTGIMGRMATYSGQVLTWDEALHSGRELVPDRFSWEMDPPVMPDKDGFYPVPVPGETEVLEKMKESESQDG